MSHRGLAMIFLAALAAGGIAAADPPPREQVREEIAGVILPHDQASDGVLTVYDGNFYVQRLNSHFVPAVRCEAAGFEGQPWLRHVLTQERQQRLAAWGFMPNPAYGNFVLDVPRPVDAAGLADRIVRVLVDIYGAE